MSKNKENKQESPTIVSKEKYRIIGHSSEYSFGDYRSYVAVRGNDGMLKHFELNKYNCEVEENLEEIIGAILEVTIYSDYKIIETQQTKIKEEYRLYPYSSS